MRHVTKEHLKDCSTADGFCFSMECADCGSHTVFVEYNNDEERLIAEKKVARLWNMGKVVKSERGE